jgi:Actinobacteria/chloroflexi VLRF1 release factor
VEVPPERLVSWIVTFTERHGGPLAVSYARPAPDRGSTTVSAADGATAVTFTAADGATAVTFTAADGAMAECHVPFPPLRTQQPLSPPSNQQSLSPQNNQQPLSPPSNQQPLSPRDAQQPLPPQHVLPTFGEGHGGQGETGADPLAAAGAIAAHAAADRTVGVLLVRLGGYAVGVFAGVPPSLGASKVGRRLVHGRSAAGGWSQHRFARRRENQAAAALGAAADAAAGIFGSYGPDGLDAVVLGGDKRSMAGLRDDARLAPYLSRATDRFLTVPDPSPAVLKGIPGVYQAIRIRLTEPEPDSPPSAGHVQ